MEKNRIRLNHRYLRSRDKVHLEGEIRFRDVVVPVSGSRTTLIEKIQRIEEGLRKEFRWLGAERTEGTIHRHLPQLHITRVFRKPKRER